MSTNPARNLYQEPKQKLSEKVSLNVNNFGSIARSFSSPSSSHSLAQSISQFTNLESSITDSYENLKKLALLQIHFQYQFEAIEKNCHLLENLKEQAQSMRR
ncbi:unnamed protein product [Allacma fusca]|uniref:BLOC-1-related complex subunit 7 n=1 Tax=Allacma fusca TaxID=39272 RepID=A0A8J2P6A3_9HEXA|nr:unnamed protein product [Allacma fusca]